jgi:hypothetical protein
MVWKAKLHKHMLDKLYEKACYLLLTSQAIHNKIQSLGFKDCLVMLSSVDSLASLKGGIVIQVLGELSNDEAPSQKFAQTFFLAEQRDGYFVLNDIFRYIKEDIESDFDDIDLDCAKEVEESDSLLPEPQPTNGLSNGFHSHSHSTVTEEEVTAKPPPMQYSSAPIDTSSESHTAGKGSSIHDEVHVQQTPAPSEETASPTEPTPPYDLRHVESASNEPQTTEDEPARAPAAAGMPTPASVEQETPIPAEVSAPTEAPASHAPKTWATLAASNAEKWHAQSEPKSHAHATTGQPKANGNQAAPNRKEVTKPSHQGSFL